MCVCVITNMFNLITKVVISEEYFEVQIQNKESLIILILINVMQIKTEFVNTTLGCSKEIVVLKFVLRNVDFNKCGLLYLIIK